MKSDRYIRAILQMFPIIASADFVLPYFWGKAPAIPIRPNPPIIHKYALKIPLGTATQSFTSSWFWTTPMSLSINSRFCFGCCACVFLKFVCWICCIFIFVLKHGNIFFAISMIRWNYMKLILGNVLWI